MSTTSSTKIAVAGATGRVGRHIVDVLHARGYDAVAMSRGTGVDVITGEGLAEALAGVEVIIDAATGPSPEEEPATSFFTTAARNLQTEGERAGVTRIVAISIIGTDKFTSGYGRAKLAHEQATLAGPVLARILRAAQFHEFVEELMNWGRQGDVTRVPRMRTQLVAARTVAEAAVDLATATVDPSEANGARITEVAGPRQENLAAMAALIAARRGESLTVEEVRDPEAHEQYESGMLLPGPGAKLSGPTFEEWLATEVAIPTNP